MHLPHHDDEILTTHQEETKYCNDWAVQIHGGLEMANHIASKHGFINLGQVQTLKIHEFILCTHNQTSTESSLPKLI